MMLRNLIDKLLANLVLAEMYFACRLTSGKVVLESRSCGTKTQLKSVSNLVEMTVGHKLSERFESRFLCYAEKMSQVENCESVPIRSIGVRR